MNKKNTLLTLALCSLFLLNYKLANAQCHIDDWTALKALYEATDGDNWYVNDGWEVVKSDEPPVDCNLENLFGIKKLDGLGRVKDIKLSSIRMRGSIPSEISKLSNLTVLDLTNNQLTSIPPEISNLSSLIRLVLYQNYISTIPPKIGNFDQLVTLDLGFNRLSSIPQEIGIFTNLSNLYINNNELVGNIPPEIGKMTNLNQLNFSHNQLSGDIPPELGNCNDLWFLILNDNQLSGNIPIELSNLNNLWSLNFSDNELSGNIPSELGNMERLEFLNLSNNQLSGNIPTEFSQLNLSYFIVSNNQLSGNIPNLNILIDEYSDFLYEFHFEYNYFICDDFENFELESAPTPEGGLFLYDPQRYSHTNEKNIIINSLEESVSLRVPFNQPGDFTYQWHKNGTGISGANETVLNLNKVDFDDMGRYNLFITESGCIPNVPEQSITNISDPITVKRNDSKCHIDDWAALKALYEATSGDIWFEKDGWEIIKGEEPPLDCDLSKLYGIRSLDQTGRVSNINLRFNRLNGIIPPEISYLTNLSTLVLTRNGLTSISPEIGDLSNLKILELNINPLTSIPPELGNLPKLENLLLEENELISIPPELGNLNNLRYLNLDDNKLVSIPSELGNLSSLVSLSIDYNELTNIPPELGNLINLNRLQISYNQLEGSIPPELGNLSSLKKLDLSNNQLTGIPPEIGDLANLETLYLDYNELSGNIISELGNLSSLQSISLRNNQLSGSIPPELGNLNKLQHLYLYNNQLEGSIPPELGNLDKLFYMYLYDNKLTGSIPSELGNLTNLVGLYLDNNQLTGSIPTEFSNLNLSYFNVSYNQLSGLIPNMNLVIDEFAEYNWYEFNFEYNYFTCDDFENFDLDELFSYDPQRYSHNAEKNVLVNSSDETISLSAPFNQTGNFTYQWHKDGRRIPGANETILNLNNIDFNVRRYNLFITEYECIANGSEEGITYISDPIFVSRADLEGCTDINSCNYNEFAMIDDGSCEYVWCDTMTNPIKIRTTNETILSDTQIKFDLVIDSLGLDYSADGLTLNLDTRGNYNFESVEVVNPNLSIVEVDISKLRDNIISIDRINSQRLGSNEPVLSITACIVSENIPTGEETCSHFAISGGTELSSGHFIRFDDIYIDIPFSDCRYYYGYGAEGENWLPVVLTVSPQNCNLQKEGVVEIKIFEDGQSPFTYSLKNENGEITHEGSSTSEIIKLNGISAGNYELTISDANEKQTQKHTCVPLITNVNSNETCNKDCVDYLIIPNGEIIGTHFAKKEIEVRGFISGDETVEIKICD